MDKNAIKKYAIWARRELIERVSQRAMFYGVTSQSIGDPNAAEVNGRLLSPGEKKQRQALIQNVKEKGFNQVMEEVAYTWFNRFAALRFMEVNGYLPSLVRVFTNEAGEFKPQILSEALHLDLYGLDKQKVLELERGNKSEELFRYLLIVQCNALNGILPGMFQKIEDYTELLLPDNLLREGSVIEQMVTTIPEEDWTDQVQIIGWLYQYYNTEPKDKVFADLKKNIKISKENIPAATQLFTPDWIVHCMVENSLGRLWLEGHPNDALKSEWKYYLDEAEQEPEVQAQLAEIRKEYAALKPEEIKVIDPCCGSGHILVVMFDVLVRIYEDYGYTAREAASQILENNLWGLDIDERAAQLSYFAVMMKARQYDRRFFSRGIQPHVYAIVESNGISNDVLEYFAGSDISAYYSGRDVPPLVSDIISITNDLRDAKDYGSIINVRKVDFDALFGRFEVIRNEETFELLRLETFHSLLPVVEVGQALAQTYHVVVTNPPYMGSSNMGATLSNYVKKHYPKTKYDLSTVFMEKTIDMCKNHGFMSMINIPVWMFLSSFEKMREELLRNNRIDCMSHFGRGVFGSDFGTTSFCVRKGRIPDHRAIYLKLYNRQGEVESLEEKERKFLAKEGRYARKQEMFLELPGAQIAYWIPDAIYDAFGIHTDNKLKFFTRSGLTTGDNDRFLKLWFEIDLTHLFMSRQSDSVIPAWYPHLKGGEYRKWYGDYDFVIHYDQVAIDAMKECPGFRHDGREFFFRKSVTWSKTTAGPLSARINYTNTTFNTAGCCLFADGNEEFALAALNSSVSTLILSFLCPSLSYAPGDVAKVPILLSERKREIEQLATECIEISKIDWNSFETSWDYQGHPFRFDTSGYIKTPETIKEAFEAWHDEAQLRFEKLKDNEEQINRCFIDAYQLNDEISYVVSDRDVTVSKADLQRDIRSFISYSVGCMFGRYSLDRGGIVFAGGSWNPGLYNAFTPDMDNIIPICDDEYFEDDIVGRFIKLIETVYGAATLEENLRFIANALGGKGSSREVIRNYFINDFYADHLKVYQKRPIYWLFDSGKKNGFKCLIYMHRYQPDTIARIRTDYVHEQQSRYRTAIADLEHRVAGASPSERVKLSKQLSKIRDQAEELRVYEEKIHHLADQMISIDLDDGVKVNYAKFQDVLAKIK